MAKSHGVSHPPPAVVTLAAGHKADWLCQMIVCALTLNPRALAAAMSALMPDVRLVRNVGVGFEIPPFQNSGFIALLGVTTLKCLTVIAAAVFSPGTTVAAKLDALRLISPMRK